jgi:integral membrane protein (TIGR01906 family)
MTARLTEQLTAWSLGVLEVILGMALSLWLLTSPALFRIYYPTLSVSAHARDAAAILDWLATNYRERSLNLALADAKLTQKELTHYSDVRRVFRQFPKVTLGLAFLTVLLAVALRPSLRVISIAQWRGLIFWSLLVLLVGGWAWWDWKQFFAWVHHPFFGDTSWRLPNNSYSLQLFPAPFWAALASAVLLAPVLLVGPAALALKTLLAKPPEALPEIHDQN